jgi:hypothetical protein
VYAGAELSCLCHGDWEGEREREKKKEREKE